MLRFDLAEIVRTVGMHQVYDIEHPAYTDDDVQFLEPVTGRITVTNSGSLLLIRGHIHTVMLLECARCLAPVHHEVDAEIEEQYTLTEVEHSIYRDVVPAIVSDEENEIPLGLFDGLVLNLNVLVYQAALLSAPIQPLCSEDCAGLCPHCGINRNIEKCDCASKVTSGPFAALGQLLKDFKSEDN
jgi:uncharacterized protein